MTILLPVTPTFVLFQPSVNAICIALAADSLKELCNSCNSTNAYKNLCSVQFACRKVLVLSTLLWRMRQTIVIWHTLLNQYESTTTKLYIILKTYQRFVLLVSFHSKDIQVLQYLHCRCSCL